MSESPQKKRLPRGQGRERILSSATDLFLKNGFEATSPQAIYALSGVGQGSFYHHFSNKDDLANAVLERMVEEKTAELNYITTTISNPKERLEAYLKLPRKGTEGCKFGRFMYETSGQKQELNKPIQEFFDGLLRFLSKNFQAAQEQELISSDFSAEELSFMLVEQIQGGYIMSRIYRNDDFQVNTLKRLAKQLGLILT
ncbi:MAG: TetR/AcrR family transcriptional repressor of nem operon [Colwellia sp.]|jgi:TetR/AcrR family transcriptional repressor of nem operon|tara:strand:- start:10632 stop:11228 length:597 start_codon:yes stop_codon:yes gene_type:complete